MRFILLIFLLSFGSSLEGQDRVSAFRAQAFGYGGNLSVLTYSGDVDGSSAFPGGKNLWKIGINFTAQHRMAELPFSIGIVYVRANLGYFPMGAQSANYDFSNHAAGFNIGLHTELISLSDLRPHLFVGGGLLYFKPSVTMKTEAIRLMWDDHKSNQSLAPVIPVGFGLTWTVGKTFDVYYQFVKTIVFSDNLDGWVSNIKDNYQEVAFGLLYYPGKDR